MLRLKTLSSGNQLLLGAVAAVWLFWPSAVVCLPSLPLDSGQGNASGMIECHDQKVQGTWVVVSVDPDTKELPSCIFKNARLIFAANKMTIKDPKGRQDGKFQLDPGKTPATIDFGSSRWVTNRGLAVLDSALDVKGVYRFRQGLLEICCVIQCDASIFPKARPTDFAAKGADPQVKIILKRETP